MFWGNIEHTILDTDYDNYALIYGCRNIGIFHDKYVTLLSREKFVQFPYVKAAKDKMDEINYDYNTYWLNVGAECGYGTAMTLDEIMIAEFSK